MRSTMTTPIQTLMLMLLFIEIGFVLGYLVCEYRHAGKELRRVREQFENDKRRYGSV